MLHMMLLCPALLVRL
ncbi:hypothetical protein Nmel_008921, partial [Mimus melanotis]